LVHVKITCGVNFMAYGHSKKTFSMSLCKVQTVSILQHFWCPCLKSISCLGEHNVITTSKRQTKLITWDLKCKPEQVLKVISCHAMYSHLSFFHIQLLCIHRHFWALTSEMKGSPKVNISGLTDSLLYHSKFNYFMCSFLPIVLAQIMYDFYPGINIT